MRSKRIRFGPGDTLGSTAPLIMMGSIDACQPRRRRARAGRVLGLLWLVLLGVLGLTVWAILDGFRNGTLQSLLT